jgi:HD-like signal output (HDOD) protein
MQVLTQTADGNSLEELLLQLLRKEIFPFGFLKDLESFSKFKTLKSDDPEYIDKVMSFLETDFYLAAQSIFSANSYEFKDRARVENLKQAAVRVGIRTIQNFGLNYDPTVDGSHKDEQWEVINHKLTTHSVFIGLLCFYYATVCRGKHPENCYLVGFFHEIGGVCLTNLLTQELAKVSKKSPLLESDPDGSALAELRMTGNKFSAVILQKLHFPKFAVQSLMPADPENSGDNYFKKALETAHVIEECLGNHLLLKNNNETFSPDKGEESIPLEKGPSEDAEDDWIAACEKATDMLKKKFPDAPVEVAVVEEIATLMKGHLEKTKRLIGLRVVR